MTKEEENSYEKLSVKDYKLEHSLCDNNIGCCSSNSIIEVEKDNIIVGGIRMVNKLDIINHKTINRILFDYQANYGVYQLNYDQILIGGYKSFALIDRNLKKLSEKKDICKSRILQFCCYDEKGFNLCTEKGDLLKYGFQ